MRIEKLKSFAAVSHAARHNVRDYTDETRPEGIEPTLTDRNMVPIGASRPVVMAKLRERLALVKRKIGKNQPLAVEYFVGRSPDVNVSDDKYANDAVNWIFARHGKENVINVAFHQDEKTPHTHVLVVPLQEVTRKNGRKEMSLSAKRFFDGPRQLSDMQTDFHDKVGKQHGLERGELRSTRRHTPVREYRAAKAEIRAKAFADPKVPKKQKEQLAELSRTYNSMDDLAGKVAAGEMDVKQAIQQKKIAEYNQVQSETRAHGSQQKAAFIQKDRDALIKAILDADPRGNLSTLQQQMREVLAVRHQNTPEQENSRDSGFDM